MLLPRERQPPPHPLLEYEALPRSQQVHGCPQVDKLDRVADVSVHGSCVGKAGRVEVLASALDLMRMERKMEAAAGWAATFNVSCKLSIARTAQLRPHHANSGYTNAKQSWPHKRPARLTHKLEHLLILSQHLQALPAGRLPHRQPRQCALKGLSTSHRSRARLCCALLPRWARLLSGRVGRPEHSLLLPLLRLALLLLHLLCLWCQRLLCCPLLHCPLLCTLGMLLLLPVGHRQERRLPRLTLLLLCLLRRWLGRPGVPHQERLTQQWRVGPPWFGSQRGRQAGYPILQEPVPPPLAHLVFVHLLRGTAAGLGPLMLGCRGTPVAAHIARQLHAVA